MIGRCFIKRWLKLSVDADLPMMLPPGAIAMLRYVLFTEAHLLASYILTGCFVKLQRPQHEEAGILCRNGDPDVKVAELQ